ncbi:MAG: hypothetical protein NC396_07660 [Bacteroides sp.]|nr:hypothetical protein [Bacteroides sp.]MCM1086169.1 hypothetical protein [Bacteroides sp.]
MDVPIWMESGTLTYNTMHVAGTSICSNDMFRRYLSAGLAVFFGGMIYLLFRPESVGFAGIFQHTEPIRITASDTNLFAYFFLYCLPDALWYWALLHLQFVYNKHNINKLLLIAAILLPFILEFMQFFGICRGTFDWCDVFTYLTVLIITTWKQKQKLGFALLKSQSW